MPLLALDLAPMSATSSLLFPRGEIFVSESSWAPAQAVLRVARGQRDLGAQCFSRPRGSDMPFPTWPQPLPHAPEPVRGPICRLKEIGIPEHLTCLLRNLYAGQEATVRTGQGTTDWFQIGKGVRQGCILSPCLFNLHAEYIMRNAGLVLSHSVMSSSL